MGVSNRALTGWRRKVGDAAHQPLAAILRAKVQDPIPRSPAVTLRLSPHNPWVVLGKPRARLGICSPRLRHTIRHNSSSGGRRTESVRYLEGDRLRSRRPVLPLEGSADAK